MNKTLSLSCAIAAAVIASVAGRATLVGAVPQQPAANTEVYLTNLDLPGAFHTGDAALNISNDPEYDNQPSFTPDGAAVLFTSKRDGRQTDIYRYDIATQAVTQLTHTPESEYSPLVTPDGKGFSVIRVEADGTTQRLWKFDLDGSHPRLVLENVKRVGYHVWIDDTRLALFVVGERGEPTTLQLADTITGNAVLIDSNIGRSLLKCAAGNAVTYISKQTTPWTIKEFDPDTKAIRGPSGSVGGQLPVAEGSEDLACMAGAASHQTFLVMAHGPKIFLWSTFTNGQWAWTTIGDLTSQHIDRITRLRISPVGTAQLRLAFVAEPAK